MISLILADWNLGLINPHTASTFFGIFTFNFDKSKLFNLTAMAAPPPLLLERRVLIYLMPWNSSNSLIPFWCLLFSSLSQISVMNATSVSLSFMSSMKLFNFGKKTSHIKIRYFRKRQFMNIFLGPSYCYIRARWSWCITWWLAQITDKNRNWR